MSHKILGRAQARQGRISRKAKRGHFVGGKQTGSLVVRHDDLVVQTAVVRDRVTGEVLARNRQQIRQDNIGVHVRESMGTDRLVDVERRDFTEVEYVAPKSFLVVRLKPDDQLRFGERRRKLEGMAAKYKFGCTSVYGPIAFVDDERGVVDIKLRGTDFENLADMLVKQRWLQSTTDPRMFSKVSSSQSREFAVKFCEHHAGEWFALRGASEPIVDYLFRAEWLDVMDHTRALPGNGTTEHLLAAHPYRKPKARSKSDLCDGRFMDSGDGIMDVQLSKSPRCGLTAAEVAASRRNNNDVKYIPRIAPKIPRTPSVPAMHAAGHYVQFGG